MTRDQMRLLPAGTWLEYRYFTSYLPKSNTFTNFTVWAQFHRPVYRNDARALITTDFHDRPNRTIAVKPEKLILI